MIDDKDTERETHAENLEALIVIGVIRIEKPHRVLVEEDRLGFFKRDLDPFSGVIDTIYVVSRDAQTNRLGCLASDDHGTTWYDYAVSEPVRNTYAIGGCREVTRDGYVIGSFTEPGAATADTNGNSKVYFFRIRAGLRVSERSKRAQRGSAQLPLG